MKLSEALDRFLIYLQANGRSENTQAAYRRDLASLSSWVEDVEQITPDLLHQVVASAAGSEATVNRLKASIKSFFRWLTDVGVLPADPARMLRTRRMDRQSPETLTEAERKRMLKEVAARKGPAAARDLVMLEAFLGTGIRLAELVGLDIADVDLDAKRITIRAKGGRVETRFVNSDLRTTLRKYLRRRADIPSHSSALFLSNRNERITGRQVQIRFEQWLAWAGIDREGLTVHSLRHTFGTRLYRKTKDLVLVGKAMGHRTTEATRIYVHDDQEALEEAVEGM